MGMPKFDILGWAKFGAIAGLASALFMKVLPMIPQFQVTFSTIAVNLRSMVTGVGGEEVAKTASTYLLGLVGQEFSLPGLAYAILGGAIVFVAARFLYGFVEEYLPKGKQARLVEVMMIGSIIQLLIMQGLGIPAVSVIAGFLVNAIVVGFGLGLLYDQFKMQVPD